MSSSAQVVLTDGNAQVDINPQSQAGVYNWTVDNQDYLAKQWFWYRVGNTRESSIDTLSLSAVTLNGLNQAKLDYAGTGFNLEVTYSLLGGTAGSGASDLAEQVKIINTSSSSALDFHLFLYTDFDLGFNGTPAGDTLTGITWSQFPVSSPGYRSATQIDGLDLQQTTLGSFADRAEADFFATTLNRLNDGVATTLTSAGSSVAPLGPGDVTYTFQWDINIAAGSSEVIGIDKRLDVTPIPEPTTATLSLLALVGLASNYFRKRH